MPTLVVCLLGDFQLHHDNKPVANFNQSRLQSLFTYLILHRHAPQSRQHLAFNLWPDSSEPQARTNLRNLLYQLRHALPAADRFLCITPQTLQWQADADYVLDVGDFESALCRAEAAAGDATTIQTALEHAVACYNGHLMPHLYDEWIVAERERLHLYYQRALERLVTLLESQQDYAAALSFGQRLLCDDPLREESYRTLIRLYALNDDRASALRVYDTCVATLQRELDVPPTPATQELAQLVRTNTGKRSTSPKIIQPTSTVPLVGRRSAWHQLLAAWRRVGQGRPEVVLVTGDAGIGKTRLAEELVTWTRRQGMAAVTACCYTSEGSPAYAPVVTWLRMPPLQQALPHVDAVWQSELTRLLPELTIMHPELPTPTRLLSNHQRHRLFEALTQVITATRQPLLLVLDDLHCCDVATLEWLHYLLRVERALRLLIVGTLDSSVIDNGHALTSWRSDLLQAQQLTAVALGPLSEEASAELAAMLVGHRLDKSQELRLYKETEGYPLFIYELVEAGLASADEQDVAGHCDSVTCSTLTEQSLPPRLQALLEARLHTLSPATQEVISSAAVIGREFTVDQLGAISNTDDAALLYALDEAWQRHIIDEQVMNHYRFSHGKLRQVAYARLSQTRRNWLQRRISRCRRCCATQ